MRTTNTNPLPPYKLLVECWVARVVMEEEEEEEEECLLAAL